MPFSATAGKLVNSGFARDRVPVKGGVGLWIPAASASPEYDADGNLTDDGRRVYTWDGEQCDRIGSILDGGEAGARRVHLPMPRQMNQNRLVSMVPTAAALSGNAPDVELRFHYDHMSRRIGKTVTQSGNTTRQACAYDHWNPVAEWELAGGALTLKRTHLWGLDIASSGHGPNYQAAGGVGGLIAVTSHSALPTCHFPSYDANGNIIAWSDSTGTLLQRRDYDPFGNAVLVENLAPPETIAKLPTHGFSTKPLDATIGLHYYGYRWYDAPTGRWPSRDPIEEEGGINLYGFVGNDGVNRLDILGNSVVTVPDVEVSIGSGNSVTFATETPIMECVPGTLAGVRVCYDTGKKSRDTKSVSLDLAVVSDFKVDFCNKTISQSGAISI